MKYGENNQIEKMTKMAKMTKSVCKAKEAKWRK
jgi:hypothetical protein